MLRCHGPCACRARRASNGGSHGTTCSTFAATQGRGISGSIRRDYLEPASLSLSNHAPSPTASLLAPRLPHPDPHVTVCSPSAHRWPSVGCTSWLRRRASRSPRSGATTRPDLQDPNALHRCTVYRGRTQTAAVTRGNRCDEQPAGRMQVMRRCQDRHAGRRFWQPDRVTSTRIESFRPPLC